MDMFYEYIIQLYTITIDSADAKSRLYVLTELKHTGDKYMALNYMAQFAKARLITSA